jgi:hypothetical protein
MKNRWKTITVSLLFFAVTALLIALAVPKQLVVDEKPQISFKNEIRDKDHARFTSALRSQTYTSKTLKSDGSTYVKRGFMERLRHFSYVGTAWAEEWECNDPNFPINCNNGVCCEAGSFCCYLHCCPSGALCCPTGCCPAGYPWFCPENNRCYELAEDATLACGSILQECR